MKYLVIGAAKSGIAAAKLAKRNGFDVILSESKPANDFADVIAEMDALGIQHEFGGNTLEALAGTDCIITSPGVPRGIPLFEAARERNIPIISELEFGRSFIPNNPLIAVTGTNGKTTTTTLITYIFNRAGRTAHSAGNIGTPISELVDKIKSTDFIIAELSSFQLDHIDKFRPDFAVILNITPDHLYYHKTFEDYRDVKFRVAENMTPNDCLLLNADDENTATKYAHTKGKIYKLSMQAPQELGVYNRNGSMCIKLSPKAEEEKIMKLNEILLPGTHNAYNSMAAALAARVFEISNENIRDSLMAFEGVEHRLEFVRTLDGIDYVNDSKATNINATWYALSSYKKPLVWIAGGRGDNNDYSALDELVRQNVKSIVAIGEEADAIFNHFAHIVRIEKADSMEEAVEKARKQAEDGDIVLFTPACKSFDWFNSYEHRGEVFKKVVRRLK